MNIFLVVLWASYPLTVIFNYIFSRVPIISDIKEYTYPIFVVICMFFALSVFFHGNYIKSLVFYCVTAMVIAFGYVYAPIVNMLYIEEYLPSFFFTVLPFVFVGNAYRDERIFRILFWVSIVAVFVFYLFNFYIHPISEEAFDDSDQESQGLAYRFLPYYFIILWFLFQKFDIIKLLVSAISLIVLLLLGARGPILCVVVFVVLYLIICNKIYKKIGWIILLLLGAALFIVFLEQILLVLFEFASDMGYSTRIIEMMVEGEMADDNGREYIIDRIIYALNDHPLGLGLCGVQALTSEFYAHNLFLELIATYGWGIGGVMSLAFIVLSVKGFRCCNSEIETGFYLVLLCCSVVPLMVSSIFLKEPLFFMFIGYNFYLIDKAMEYRPIIATSAIK